MENKAEKNFLHWQKIITMPVKHTETCSASASIYFIRSFEATLRTSDPYQLDMQDVNALCMIHVGLKC